jgi:preprotein translocase subunit SecG
MVRNVISVLFLLLCAGLIAVILTQHRKSGGFSGSFGGGTQMDMSGGSWQRMSTMTKITVVLTAVFMVLSLVLLKLKA